MLVNFYMENNLSKDINKQQTTNNKQQTEDFKHSLQCIFKVDFSVFNLFILIELLDMSLRGKKVGLIFIINCLVLFFY